MLNISAARRAQKQTLELNIAPLIDMVFILLIFFLVTSTLLPKEGNLEMALSGIGEVPSLPPLEVEITEAGAVLVDSEPVEAAGSGAELPGLVALLDRHMRISGAANSEPVVIFKLADKARHQRFIDVLNAVSGAGINQVMMRP